MASTYNIPDLQKYTVPQVPSVLFSSPDLQEQLGTVSGGIRREGEEGERERKRGGREEREREREREKERERERNVKSP